jgi:hypothetical protein
MTTSKSLTNLTKALVLAAIVAGVGRVACAGEMTAFQLIKEADRYVGEEAKDQVVQLRSEKSIGSLQPNIWYVVFYDPDATFKATEVKFGGGKKLDVKRPMRMLEMASGNSKLDSKKLNTDSDKAIKIATADPLLNNIKVTATQLWLDKGDDGPTWKVRLWAQKLRDPSRDADIGDIYITSDDGKVVKRDLHIDRLD